MKARFSVCLLTNDVVSEWGKRKNFYVNTSKQRKAHSKNFKMIKFIRSKAPHSPTTLSLALSPPLRDWMNNFSFFGWQTRETCLWPKVYFAWDGNQKIHKDKSLLKRDRCAGKSSFAWSAPNAKHLWDSKRVLPPFTELLMKEKMLSKEKLVRLLSHYKTETRSR